MKALIKELREEPYGNYNVCLLLENEEGNKLERIIKETFFSEIKSKRIKPQEQTLEDGTKVVIMQGRTARLFGDYVACNFFYKNGNATLKLNLPRYNMFQFLKKLEKRFGFEGDKTYKTALENISLKQEELFIYDSYFEQFGHI